MKCPGLDQLMDYCEGLLSDNDAQLMAAHLASGCGQCAENRQWYERLHALAADDTSVDPPSWVLKRAVKLFDRNPARTDPVDSLGRLVASLMFDSLSQSALAGVRLAGTTERHLLYCAGEYSIDLQFALSDPSNVDLTGQILRRNESRFESVAKLSLILSHEGEIVHSTVTDRVGEFSIDAADRREYELLIETHEGTIIVLRLPITPS